MPFPYPVEGGHNSPMTIRSATSRDAAAIAAIYDPVVRATPISFETDPPGPDEMARRIAATTRTHPWLVAEQDGVVLGYAYGAPARSRAAYRWCAEVSVYLAAEARGRGVGGELLDELLDELSRRGIATVIAGTTLPNPASVRLFESRGFEQVGVFRRAGYKLGAWHDVGWWERFLYDGDAGLPNPKTEVS
jgi:L-amino acid N-acyltransferase YncA